MVSHFKSHARKISGGLFKIIKKAGVLNQWKGCGIAK